MQSTLHAIFQNGMVFAEGKPIRIFGTGSGRVEIRFLGKTAETVCTGKEDRWMIEFPAQHPGGPYTMEIYLDGQMKTLTDLYIGKVILLAGQSNVQYKLGESAAVPGDSSDTVPQDCEMLRLYTLARLEENEFYHPEDGWVPCRTENAVNWSAIGYYMGRSLYEQYGNAIGMIACYQGASVIESWVPKGTMEVLGIRLPAEELHADHTEPLYHMWNQDGVLYDRMLREVAPFSVSEVVWYQGESDTTLAEGNVYDIALAELIRIWRREFCDDALPFIVVQIADFDERRDEGWRAVQAAQLRVPDRVSLVKTVLSADVCETHDIHPPTKDVLARRIADAVLEFD